MQKTRPATQGARIAAQLLLWPHTYMEMLALGISTCPHKRVREYLALNDEFELLKGQRQTSGGDVLVTWEIKRKVLDASF